MLNRFGSNVSHSHAVSVHTVFGTSLGVRLGTKLMALEWWYVSRFVFPPCEGCLYWAGVICRLHWGGQLFWSSIPNIEHCRIMLFTSNYWQHFTEIILSLIWKFALFSGFYCVWRQFIWSSCPEDLQGNTAQKKTKKICQCSFFLSVVIMTLEKMFGDWLQWALACAMPQSGASGNFLSVSELFQVNTLCYIVMFSTLLQRVRDLPSTNIN